MNIPIKYKADGTNIDGTFPLIILGPNGSGKTRYGRELAKWNKADIISALRKIALGTSIERQNISYIKQKLENYMDEIKTVPWRISGEIDYLFSKLIIEDSNSAIELRDKYYEESGEPEVEVTNLMKLKKLWHTLFPGRIISFKDNTSKVTIETVDDKLVIDAEQMSEGERVALYLAGRVLDSNPGVIIIDEPEVHFHSRLAIQFWNELELLRKDCRFVYITHDLTFARSRETSKFLIIRPNKDPELVDISEGDIPTDITESILSAASFSIYANKLIFCEGTEKSFDQRFLRAWYNKRNIEVIPVGSCGDVIQCTKTYCESKIISGISAIGIIDYDYGHDKLFSSLHTEIHVLPVHEIESLFCLRAVFIALARHQGINEAKADQLYQEFLKEAKSRFVNELKRKQIIERVKRRCKDQIHKAINKITWNSSETQVINDLCSFLSPTKWEVHPKTIFNKEKSLIEKALELTSSNEDFLKYLPGKSYYHILAEKIGVKKFRYVELIVDSLKSNPRDDLNKLGRKIRSGLKKLFPNV